MVLSVLAWRCPSRVYTLPTYQIEACPSIHPISSGPFPESPIRSLAVYRLSSSVTARISDAEAETPSPSFFGTGPGDDPLRTEDNWNVGTEDEAETAMNLKETVREARATGCQKMAPRGCKHYSRSIMTTSVPSLVWTTQPISRIAGLPIYNPLRGLLPGSPVRHKDFPLVEMQPRANVDRLVKSLEKTHR